MLAACDLILLVLATKRNANNRKPPENFHFVSHCAHLHLSFQKNYIVSAHTHLNSGPVVMEQATELQSLSRFPLKHQEHKKKTPLFR